MARFSESENKKVDEDSGQNACQQDKGHPPQGHNSQSGNESIIRRHLSPAPFVDSVDSPSIKMADKMSEKMADKMATKLSSGKEKIINDSIHGHIKFPPVAMAVIDTPQFQRLRFIKQLGSCHWVYPAAVHNRFQHCLGVGFLALKFATTLRQQMPDLVDEKDIHCVMLAGLCHDLGHGPFSHLWETYVKKMGDQDWHHEDASIQMLDSLLDQNKLREKMASEFDIQDEDVLFIKEMIAGPIDPGTGLPTRTKDDSSLWPYKGRKEDKSFLYEIVANKISGIDVDKWDYFLRDDYSLKIGHVFNYERFISYARVITTGTPARRHICLRDKEAELLREMCQDRARLHQNGYQHRVSKIIDQMTLDAFALADEWVLTKGTDGQTFPLSRCHQDIEAYQKLTDSVFEKVLESDCLEAVDLLRRIQRRQIYKDIGSVRLSPGDPLFDVPLQKITREIRQKLPQGQESSLSKEVLVIDKAIKEGMNAKKAFFYQQDLKGQLQVSDSLQLQLGLPTSILYRTIWVCCKSCDPSSVKQVISAFNQWKESSDIQY